MKETHDASVVKFDSVCVDLFFRRLTTNGKLKKEIANAGCIIYKIVTSIL